MPSVQLYIMGGRGDEQRRRPIERITEAICEVLDARRDAVRVILQDVAKDCWGIGGKSAKELGR